ISTKPPEILRRQRPSVIALQPFGLDRVPIGACVFGGSLKRLADHFVQRWNLDAREITPARWWWPTHERYPASDDIGRDAGHDYVELPRLQIAGRIRHVVRVDEVHGHPKLRELGLHVLGAGRLRRLADHCQR